MDIVSKSVKLLCVLLLVLLSGVKSYGQSYLFKVKYGMIQAGTATLELNEQEGILTGQLHIESSPWLSNLWTLSDSIVSVFELGTDRLQSHIKAIHEGEYHRNYTVVFPDSNHVSVNGEQNVLNTQGLKDIPSLLHDLSQISFRHGDTLSYKLWDGKGFAFLDLLVERISGPSFFKPFSKAGWLLTPLSSSRKSRENHIQLTLLLSATFPHQPMRIEISSKYGNIIMHRNTP